MCIDLEVVVLAFASLSESAKSRLSCLDFLVPVHRVQRADKRTRTAFLLITSALLAILVGPNGLLAELRPYPS